jgi:phospholipid/cholesterol/gamma-HCH transport system permease protein
MAGDNNPSWTVEGEGAARRVRLHGSWALFLRSDDRQRLLREFQALEAPGRLAWDLSAIERFDSAGAWLLWQTWGRQIPVSLECDEQSRQWFENFQTLPEHPSPGMDINLWRFLERFGASLNNAARVSAGLFALLVGVFGEILRCVLRPRLTPWREISASIYHTGVSSLVLLGITGYVIGVVMALQLGVTLKHFGANAQIIGLMGLAVLRELGPVIAAIIQVGRAGSSITAGIAGMHITEELDALRTFGASPQLRLVMPKVVALVIAMPLLVVWTDFTEILGGATTAQFDLGVPYALFLARLPHEVSLFNFWMGLAKGAVFGVIIGIVGSYFGLKSEANTSSLSQQTTHSVVVGLSVILIFDALSGAILAKLGYL